MGMPDLQSRDARCQMPDDLQARRGKRLLGGIQAQVRNGYSHRGKSMSETAKEYLMLAFFFVLMVIASVVVALGNQGV